MFTLFVFYDNITLGDKIMNCIFCKIINGEIPSFTIYEDEVVKIFLDASPKANGHALIVPKKHFKDLFDIDSNTLMHIIEVAKKMEPTFREKLHCEGLTLIQNNGIAEEVKHFHLHLLPVYSSNDEIMNPEDVYNQIIG